MDRARGRIPGNTRHFAHAGFALAVAAALLGGCSSRSKLVGRVGLPEDRAKEAVVMAWPENAAPPAPSAGRARVLHEKGRFEPAVLVVEAGAKVEFENQDRVFHKVFSVTPQARFTLGPYRPGETRVTAFEKSGVVQVWCELHPHESLYVVVVPGRWHTRPGKDGGFAFDGLPHGRYMVRAWHPKHGMVTRRIEVPTDDPMLLSFDR